MDDNSSPTYAELQARVRELEDREASLMSDLGTVVHLAADITRALAARPEGFWIKRRDLGWAQKLAELDTRTSTGGAIVGNAGAGGAGAWVWQKVRSSPLARPSSICPSV